jgi:DNA-binding SARP family transcriptional activator/tetratricopeptide (TPR) repeat protein
MESAPAGPLVSLLGPVEISAGGRPAQISQQGLRALLALLALAPNRVVPVPALIDGLWQEEPSRARELNLHARIFQLRKHLAALEPDLPQSRIVTHERGYLLALGPDELDLSRFASLAGRGRAAASGGDPAAAAHLLRQALRLWRGPALADVIGSSDRLAAEACGLEEQRLDTCASYAEAMLAAGWHGELIGELAAVVGEHPWQERLRQQLMLAYYRSGRQADALACFDEGSEVLGRDLGVRPGKALQDLRAAILRADPALARPAAPLVPAAAAAASAPAAASASSASVAAGTPAAAVGPVPGGQPAPAWQPVIPRQLPAGSRHFAGRTAELEHLDALLDQVRPAGPVVITAIGGTGGVGKTALALHWAHRVAGRFPDGQLHVNLRGYDPGGTPVSSAVAIRGFLDALGVPAAQVPASAVAQAALYRSVLAGRRMLILLDNASDPAQVRPLLPAAPGCLVVVTSRSALAGLTTAEGAIPLPLGLVSRTEARQLLAARLGPARVAAEPAAVSRLIELCARLPLALAIAGARAAAGPAMPLASLAAELEDNAGRLDALDSGDPATSVRAVFSWSLRQLSSGAARLFRLLGLHPGADVSAAAAASLAGLPPAEARRLIGELVNAGLLAEHKPGRYAFHDLLRAYAAEQASDCETEADRRLAIRRLLDHYLHTASPAGVLLFGSRDLPQPAPSPLADTEVSPERPASRQDAIAWFDAELQALSAATALAESCGLDEYAWQLPCTMTEYFRVTGSGREWARLNETALRAAGRTGDPAAIGRAHFSIGTHHRITGAFAGALAHLTLAMEQFLAAGDRIAQASAHMGLAKVHFSQRVARSVPEFISDSETAVFHAGQALAIYRQLGDATGEGRALVELAEHYRVRGELAAALQHCTQATELFLALGAQANVVMATETLGRIQFGLGRYDQAIACYLESLRGNAEAGIKIRPPNLLEDLGDAYLAAGNAEAAEAAWRAVVDFGRQQERLNEIPTWRRDRVLAKLAQLRQTPAASGSPAVSRPERQGPSPAGALSISQ